MGLLQHPVISKNSIPMAKTRFTFCLADNQQTAHGRLRGCDRVWIHFHFSSFPSLVG